MLSKRLKFLKKFNRTAFPAGVFLVFLLALIQICQASEKQSAMVQDALTGDTILLEGGKTLKYIGLNAPSLHSSIPLEKQYGVNSLAFNKKAVLGKKILIEW